MNGPTTPQKGSTMSKTIVAVDPKIVDAKIAELSTERFHLDRGITGQRAIIANEGGWYQPYQIERAEQRLAELESELSRLTTELWETEAPYRQLRWSRFFLVNNNGGHIHSSMDCSTCNKMGQLTSFGWLPELSGETEEQAVAAHGAILCTVCYPSAPVSWTNAHEVAAEAKKATQCKGSGSYLNRDLKHRVGYVAGNWATCETCGDPVTLTKSFKLRAHKPPKA